MEPQRDEGMAQRFEAALERMGAYFMGSSPLQEAAAQIARLLGEMKLASGMTAPHRLQDLADVLRLIAVAKLPRELGGTLDAYVQPKYDELWQTAQRPEEDY